MFVLVPLNRVQMNPWQPRQHHDEAHIAALAADIQARVDTKPDTLGLLQLLAGRIVGADGRTPVTIEGRRGINFSIALVAQDAWVQLAYGHSRFAAFCLLAKTDKRFAKVPVELVAWNDEEMATSAWSENEARSALNPLEKAMALQRYMADFGWTQQHLGERLKLDRSTVANKLRLLKLAPDAQALLATGALSERQAQALVPLADLPAEALARAEKEWEKPSKLLAEAPLLSSDAIRDRVHRVVNVATRDLKLAVFPHDQDVGAADVVSPTCSTCPIRVRRGEEWRCPDYGCFDRKTAAWKAQQLRTASTALGGLPIADELTPGAAITSFRMSDPLAEIRQQGCGHLHVQWRNYGTDVGLPIDPHCQLVCVHGQGKHCACVQRIKADAKAADPEEQARTTREHESQSLRDQAAHAVHEALAFDQVEVWRAVAVAVNYALHGKIASMDVVACQRAIAQTLVDHKAAHFGNDVDRTRDTLATMLGGMDVPRPWQRPTLVDVEKKLARIEGWLAGAHAEPPTPAALRGNLDNLDRLLFEELPGVPGADRIGARIMSAQVDIRNVLQSLEDVGAHTLDLTVGV